VAKGIAHRHFFAVVIPVANKNPLLIAHRISVPRKIEIRGIILQAERKSFCQLAAGVRLAKQQVSRGLSHGFSAKIHLQNRLCLFLPGHLHRRAVVQHYNQIRLHPAYPFD